jgi:hypothetical protein
MVPLREDFPSGEKAGKNDHYYNSEHARMLWRKHMGIEPTGEISHPPH